LYPKGCILHKSIEYYSLRKREGEREREREREEEEYNASVSPLLLMVYIQQFV